MYTPYAGADGMLLHINITLFFNKPLQYLLTKTKRNDTNIILQFIGN